jgi:lipopolysaccharide/colanic/teichoic acid biosynthesis glycosyltransferase
VLFRQVRIGRHGVPFDIYKFRTMADRPDGGRQLTVGQDPRVTRAGRFLRHYKLDELPQLLNVLEGTMSLVGPRPEVPRYVECYPPAARRTVLSIRPGITDLAAILYRDESAILGQAQDPERAYVDTILPVKLEYYQRYVRERSFWLDLRIIFRTLAAILR